MVKYIFEKKDKEEKIIREKWNWDKSYLDFEILKQPSASSSTHFEMKNGKTNESHKDIYSISLIRYEPGVLTLLPMSAETNKGRKIQSKILTIRATDKPIPDTSTIIDIVVSTNKKKIYFWDSINCEIRLYTNGITKYVSQEASFNATNAHWHEQTNLLV